MSVKVLPKWCASKGTPHELYWKNGRLVYYDGYDEYDATEYVDKIRNASCDLEIIAILSRAILYGKVRKVKKNEHRSDPRSEL